MPRNVNSKYKIDRRRTRREVESPPSEHEDSESDPSVASGNDEEYSVQDDEHDAEDESEDEVEFQSPTRRSKRTALNSNRGHNGLNTDSDEDANDEVVSITRKSPRLRPKKRPSTTRKRSCPSKPLDLVDSDDDEDEGGAESDDEDHLQEDEKKDEKKNQRGQKNVKLAARNTPRNGRNRESRADVDVLANLPCPPSTGGRLSAVKASKNLTKMEDEETEDDFEADGDGDEDEDEVSDGKLQTNSGSGDEKDSDYDAEDQTEDESEKEVDEMLPKKNTASYRRNGKRTTTNRTKRKKAAHSSDEEFVVDSDDDVDDSSQECSLSDDASSKPKNVDSDIGDPDLSDDDSDDDDDDDDDVVLSKIKRNKNASANAANVDNENFGTIDDDSESDDNGKSSPKATHSSGKSEILPSPRGVKNAFESDDTEEDNPKKFICPKCPSKEDAITAEPLPRLHICYIAPDGKSRVCFNLETLRQIALKSSQLELRVDIDAERQNFLQPPAFRTPMSDDLVDQIASKFGRGALDLHGPYYKNRERKYERKDGDDDDDDEYSYGSNSSGGENIYDSFETFRERVKDYFRKGMGSQDIYACPLCYGRIHRTLVDPKVVGDNDDDDGDDDDDDEDNDNAATIEYDAAPSDSIYDPIMVLGHLDNEEMSMASQFCFKRIVDVKKHLRQEHSVDTGGIQGNELYKRFKVRAPDGLLQRWLSTRIKGQVRQGHMSMYWGQGNDQIFIQLLDLIEQVRAYTEGSQETGDDSSEGDEDNEIDEHANKAREFFDSFATRASQLWKIISSPFLKSNENVNDFIARDDDYSEEEDTGGQPHAALHQQFMNEDSDENDLVHKLQRKYAETNDNDSASRDSSTTEEELEFVDGNKESDYEEEGEGDDEDISNRNGYYSPIEEEKDEWMLKLQSQRKRKGSSVEKEASSNTKMKTPTGKKLFRRKTTPSVTGSSTTSVSKRRRTLTLEDSSDNDSF